MTIYRALNIARKLSGEVPNLIQPSHGDLALIALYNEILELEKQLRFAAGYISTTPEFSNKHPEHALEFIKKYGN